MKLPRKGILIRLAIYLPVIGFLAWRVFFARGEEAPAPVEPEPPGNVRTIAGPDGKEFKIIEVTPEEAKAMGVEIPEKPADARPRAAKPAEPAE